MMQSTNHWPGRTMHLHTYSVFIGEWFLWSLWYCLLLETGLSGVIPSVMTADTPMTSVEILFMVLNYSSTAAISWHTPSDSSPAWRQLYCLVTWKQYHCLKRRQNDNKFIFMRSLNSLLSPVCFLYYFDFPFCRILHLVGQSFHCLQFSSCCDVIAFPFAISFYVLLKFRN